MEETKIIYYTNNENIPVLIKCCCRPDEMTLGHFKKTLKRPVSQFLFKSLDEDIGEIKEEITEDDAKLPHTNGKVTAWLTIPDQERKLENVSSPENDTCKIIYYINKEKTPVLIKCRCRPDQITLGLFKKALKRHVSQFLFKHMDEDIGEIKEEITEDDAKLPYVNSNATTCLTIPDQEAEAENDSVLGNETCKTKKVNESRSTRNCKTINLLLLGETGVGKSTWINGFVNYLTYDSLDEAENGRPVSVIPATFTLTDSDFKEFEIKYAIDNDKNESMDKVGESVTQMPKSYVFSMQNVKMRIIDTPGMGDTRGIEKDKENMQNILNHLSHYTEIHGIIILLKPNNPRLTVMFEFCIKELLTYLHKDACKNIIICFTNARSTNYKAGDTMPILKELLKRNKTIDIKLNKDTVYCMDNESVRFLMAMRTIKFDEIERKDFAGSWKKAVEISKRLISYISSLEPHAIQDTLSINEIRRVIIEQSRPMAYIAEEIQMKIDEIQEKQDIEFDANKSKEELSKQLKMTKTRLKTIPLDYPRTVCTEPKCVEQINVGHGRYQTRYKTICHDRCTEISTVKNVIGSAEMSQCAVMARGWKFFTHCCKVCSCYSSSHMRMTYEVTHEVVMEEDPSIKKLIDEKEGNLKAIRQYKKQIEDKLKQLKHEKQRFVKINAHFACFLKHNSIIPFNDALLDYLNYLIRNEKMKITDSGCSKTLDGLISLKEMYEGEVKVMEDRLKASSEPNQGLDVENIAKMIKELKEMPNIGGMLKDIMTGVKVANEASMAFNETQFVMQPTETSSQIAEIINQGIKKYGIDYLTSDQ